MKKELNLKELILKFFCIFTIGFILIISEIIYEPKNEKEIKIQNQNVFSNNSDEVLYLSDIPYKKAQVGWGTLGLDKTNSNTSLIMNINGSSVVVKKGIFAHATSTVEYDISSYDYDYFTVYYGLNTTSGNNGNGVKFYIYTSEDGTNWTLRTEENPSPLKWVNPAVHVKIDIRDANYIRLYAHDNGANGSDHAVWGDAKLVKEGYSDDVMKTVEEYDEIIKTTYQAGPISEDLSLTLLQRNFIKNVGQYQLRSFLESDPKNQETFDWFINNEEALRLWTVGGRPHGSYERSLQVLSKLYHTYKEDLSNENVTALGTKYKDLYLKMMLSLSLTHSTSVGLWIGGNQLSDAVIRYDLFKQLHLNNELASPSMFENYTIDEMRGVMFTNIDDEEIMWLHDFSKKKSSTDRFNPFKYITYTLNYSYYRPQYYSQENYEKWNQKYELSKYNITYQSGKPKLWIVFEEGSVCGGLSKTAANLYGVWGTPSYVVGQPQHAAYIYLYNAGGGKYAWQLAYSVAATGWADTDGTAINGWGTRYRSNVVKSGSYRLLAQDAQNEYDKYEKAQLILLLEDVYKNDRNKLEQVYLDALKEERINLDAWIGLVTLYITDDTKTESDLIDLATEIAEVYTYHPLPMYDMLRRIGTKITSPEYRSQLMMLQDRTLRKATKATSANTIYSNEVPIIANAILGVVDSKVATFSFSGANAGKIILSKQLQSAQVTWSYSLDNGTTWTEVYEHFIELTKEELDSINVNDDIKIRISGLPLTAENIFTIDITKRTFPGGITINDQEDRIYGTTSEMEWTFDPKDGWNSFANTNPVLSGNKKLYIRVIAKGTEIASDPVYYTFTENNSDDTKWYIQSKNLEVIEVNATGAGDYKNNILDGNVNTYWRSKNGLMPAYVTIKLDQPRYISGIDYVPDKSAKYLTFVPYGRGKNLNIYVSMDGNNWELVASKNNLGDNDNLKHIAVSNPKKALYVKVECTSVYDGEYTLFAVSVIKLYENILVNETPRADVNYNITRATNQNVTAELVNMTRPITVLNNDHKTTYTFTENGKFTFEYEDENGNKGSTTAEVNWIDKTPPTLDLEFNTKELTNQDVVVTLSFDKEVTITSKDVQVAENPEDKSKTITFTENDSIELEFQDTLGNKGRKTITVDWIDKEEPTAEFEFNTTNLTDGEVIATLNPSEEVIVTNNDGKDYYVFKNNGSFTFEFIDMAGNHGTATVVVNWISTLPEYKIKYSTTKPTNQSVEVELELEAGYKIVNNNASNIYIFTNSSTFEFQYMDKDGHIGMIPITVDWIDKENPTAEAIYSPNTWTNKNVEVTLKPNEKIKITNNEGKDNYVFKDNGTFTFEFEDMAGNPGTKTVVVDWIDREAPTATIEYNITTRTDGPVIATLNPSEEVTILGNGQNTHTFYENAEFTFEFIDKAGNKGYATAVVNWIYYKENPTQNPENPTTPENNNNEDKKNKYQNLTNGNVIVKIPESIIKNNVDAKLEYNELPLSDAYKNRYGKDSIIYELALKSQNKTIDISNEIIVQTLKLNSNKKFEAIYAIRDDGSVVKLNYTINENNEIEFKDNGLGKYIISYKTETTDNTNNNDKNDNNMEEEPTQKTNYILYIAIGASSVILFGIGYSINKSKKK